LAVAGLAALRRGPRAGSGALDVRFAIVVPARNEAAVIAETVRRLRALEGEHPFVALVMNDGSTDATSDIARDAAGRDERIVVVDRGVRAGGQGKGDVLNDAYRRICALVEDGQSMLGSDAESVVLAVVDADGWLDPHALTAVTPYFADPRVAGVQLPVRMWNAEDGFLTLMQDIEFMAFGRLVQTGRDLLGSVGLGGNGQFVRLGALGPLGDTPWSRCLTEDLDLSLSLIERGHRIRFCPNACVAQQALGTMRPLLRQRTRWVQGHYSCWRHLPALLCGAGTWRRRLDACAYLLGIALVMVFSFLLVVTGLGWLGLVAIHPRTLAFIHDPRTYRTTVVVLSVAPVALVAALYRYTERTRLPLWSYPGVFLMFALYGYAWAVPATFRAGWRGATGRDRWTKTPRTPVPARLSHDRART
jgi:cellulose synthase/poly-beta-1,6-N-acetylglucosamine synthase-like glycosyltransferase